MGKTDEKVFAVFEAHADEFDISRPTLKQLAASTGLSPSSVQRAIRALIRTGRLERVTKGGGGDHSSTVYRIHRISTDTDGPSHLSLVRPSHRPSQTAGQDPPLAQSKKPLKGFLTLGGLDGSKKPPDDYPEERPWHPSDAYLRCQCGKPKIAGDTWCTWCHTTYPYVSPRAGA